MGTRVLRLSLAVTMALSFGARAGVSSPTAGILEGQVKISSERGVNLADNTSPNNEKVPYGECSLIVLSKDRRSEIAQVTTDKEGHFRVGLPAGDYILDLKRSGRNRLLATPKTFTIVAEQTVRVDMDVESNIHPMRIR
jgi:hypothetical protein